jgi:hypothetical protein
VLAVVTTICTSCITAALLVMTYHQARKYKQEAQVKSLYFENTCPIVIHARNHFHHWCLLSSQGLNTADP